MTQTRETDRDRPRVGLRKRILAGGSWVVLGKGITGVAGLALAALLARLLGQDALGVYFLASTVVLLGTELGQLGIQKASVRFIAEGVGTRQKALVRDAVRYAIAFAAVGGTLVAIAHFALARPISLRIFDAPLLAEVAVPVSVWIAGFVLMKVVAEIFRGFQAFFLATWIGDTLFRILFLSAVAILMVSRADIGLAAVAWTAALTTWLVVVLGLVALAPRYRRHRLAAIDGNAPSPRDAPTRLSAGTLLAVSMPLFLTSITTFIGSNAGILIVGGFMPPEDVAVFGSATRLVLLVIMPLMVVQAVVSPMIAELHALGRKALLERTLRAVSGVAGTVALILLAVFAIAGDRILALAFGPAFGTGHLILVILAVGQTFNVLAGACGPLLMMTGHEVPMMRISIVVNLAYVLVAVLATWSYGLVGMASAVTVAIVGQNVWMLHHARTQLDIRTFSYLDPLRIYRSLRFGLEEDADPRRENPVHPSEDDS